MSLLQFCSNLMVSLALILLPKEPRSRHDRAMIAPRSGHDRMSIAVLMLQRSSYDDRGGDSTTNDARSRLDRAVIAVRLDRDHDVLPRSVWAVR